MLYTLSMSKSVKITAFAKVNLSLNIEGRADGLHKLDSVMMSVDCFDTVTVTERADEKITVAFDDPTIDPVRNTAYKAAAAVCGKLHRGADISVQKGIPVGAGLGGSSADGAAVLRALDLFYRLPQCGIDMRAAALEVGSDVPFMLTGGLARVGGVGDELFFIDNKLQTFIVGLMSGDVSTAAAYAEFDRLYPSGVFCPSDNAALCEKLLDGDPAALGFLGNALYEPARTIAPRIADDAKRLADCGGTVNLTGSGGMVLGYFTDITAFYECTRKLRNERGFKVLAPARTGLLHEIGRAHV